jgi:hypothetical protein
LTDLEANRAGRITTRQRFRLLRGVAALLLLTAVGLIISIALGPNVLGAFGDLGIFGGVVVTIFFLLCVVMTIVGAIGIAFVLGDAVLGRVSFVTGPPTLRRVAVRTNALARPFPGAYTYPGQYKYKVMVGDKEFDIDRKLADHLSRDVLRIRVYFAAYSGELLSLEPLAATPDG